MQRKNKNEGFDITGFLLLNKPTGLSSNQALQKIKRLFRAKKAGHTGSLDPIATGMLPICFGKATKLSQFLLESNKAYHVTVKLGEKTKTGDSEGEVVEKASIQHLSHGLISKAMQEFVGEIEQTPPMFSAIKHKGTPLYELARKGIEIERKSRIITIYQFELVDFSQDYLTCFVKCSKGTYIRTLIEDCAQKLNTVAHVTALHRVYVSPFENHDMVSFEELERMQIQQGELGLHSAILPINTMLNYPKVIVSAASAFYFRMGQAIRTERVTTDMERVQVMSEQNELIGIAIHQAGFLKPERLLSQAIS